MRVVLGIDPGTGRMGYGIVRQNADTSLTAVAYGVIETSPASPMPQRLVTLYQNIQELLLLHRPDGAAVEKLFFSRNVTTAISVGQARGVALLALAQAGLDVGEYTPNEIKQTVTGYGSARKPQMQEMIRILLGLEHIPQPDDAADALAVAITHFHLARYKALEAQA
jgi:crossover junction endodeoxyribonuclease RuvC